MDGNNSDKFSWKPGDVEIIFAKKKNTEEQVKLEAVEEDSKLLNNDASKGE